MSFVTEYISLNVFLPLKVKVLFYCSFFCTIKQLYFINVFNNNNNKIIIIKYSICSFFK